MENKTIKEGKPYTTDKEYKKRVEKLKKYFANSDQKYIEFDEYYIELKKRDNSEGIRWFHRNKYQVEVVFNSLDNGPSQNKAGFVLFSNLNDALLHAVLTESSELNKRIQLKKELNNAN